MSLFHAAKDATRRRTSTAAAVVLAVLAGSARVVGAAYPGHCGQFFSLPAPDDQPSTGGSNGSGGKRSKSAAASLNVRSGKSKPTGGSSSGGGGGGDTSCDVYFDLLMKGYMLFLEDAAGEDGMMTEDEFVMSSLISQFGEDSMSWFYSDSLDSNGDGYVVLDEVPKPATEVAAMLGPLTQEELKSKQNKLETLWTIFNGYLNAMVLGTCDLDGDTVMDLNNGAEIDCFRGYFGMSFEWFDTNNDGYINLSELNLATFKHLMNCKTYLSETSDCGTVAE